MSNLEIINDDERYLHRSYTIVPLGFLTRNHLQAKIYHKFALPSYPLFFLLICEPFV